MSSPSKHPAERLDVYTKPPCIPTDRDNRLFVPCHRVAALPTSGDARRRVDGHPEDGSGMEVKPGYKQTEVGVIPEEWEVAPFGK